MHQVKGSPRGDVKVTGSQASPVGDVKNLGPWRAGTSLSRQY